MSDIKNLIDKFISNGYRIGIGSVDSLVSDNVEFVEYWFKFLDGPTVRRLIAEFDMLHFLSRNNLTVLNFLEADTQYLWRDDYPTLIQLEDGTPILKLGTLRYVFMTSDGYIAVSKHPLVETEKRIFNKEADICEAIESVAVPDPKIKGELKKTFSYMSLCMKLKHYRVYVRKDILSISEFVSASLNNIGVPIYYKAPRIGVFSEHIGNAYKASNMRDYVIKNSSGNIVLSIYYNEDKELSVVSGYEKHEVYCYEWESKLVDSRFNDWFKKIFIGYCLVDNDISLGTSSEDAARVYRDDLCENVQRSDSSILLRDWESLLNDVEFSKLFDSTSKYQYCMSKTEDDEVKSKAGMSKSTIDMLAAMAKMVED